jgi:hypothetical protein
MSNNNAMETGKAPSEPVSQLASSHSSSLAGSVIEAKDGMGGSNFIRIQNMSATGMFLVLFSYSV